MGASSRLAVSQLSGTAWLAGTARATGGDPSQLVFPQHPAKDQEKPEATSGFWVCACPEICLLLVESTLILRRIGLWAVWNRPTEALC